MTTCTGTMRAAGKTILVGLLAVFIFATTLMAGSSSLHRLLHSDHGSPYHLCLVSLLDHSHTPIPEVRSLPVMLGDVLVKRWFPSDSVFSSIDCSMLSGRGPPCPA